MKLFTLLLLFIYDDLDGFVYNDVIPKLYYIMLLFQTEFPSA